MKKAILALLVMMIFMLIGCQKECAHTYQSEITQASSCTQAGTQTYTCSICGDSYTESIPITEHTFGTDEVEKAATCAEKGVMKALCTICNTVRETPIDKLSHTFGEASVTKEPNCTEEGECTVVCTVCGASEVTEKLPTNAQHVFINTVIREATCIDPGQGINTCSLCQHSEECEYELKAHSYTSKVTKESTCTEKGSQVTTCSVCSKTKTTSIAALGHNYVTVSEENRSDTFASKCVRQCKACGIEKTLYRAGKCEIDLNEIQKDLENYAQKYGFKTTDSFSDIPYYEEIDKVSMMVWKVASSESLDWLIEQAKSKIDKKYGEKQNAISDYLMHLAINYGESASIGGGSFTFRIVVTHHAPES